MDEILCANFMVFHDVVARGAVRPVDRRRGVGARPLPAREPGAEDGAVRVADRLRRLPADAGRRRARGIPHRRLQRRDDRAHRALPARARPRDLRRRARRHRRREVRSGAAGDPRVDRAALRASAGYVPASTRGRSPTARRCARSSATATSRSASLRSAAPASARRCCAVRSRRCRSRASACPACA